MENSLKGDWMIMQSLRFKFDFKIESRTAPAASALIKLFPLLSQKYKDSNAVLKTSLYYHMDGDYSFLNAWAHLNIQLPQLLVSLSTQYEGAYM
jgi:hypothetical protein